MIATTQEQLAKLHTVLEQLDERLENKEAESRRQRQRMVIRTPMTAMLLASGGVTPIEIFSRNISCSGIGFVARRLFAAEERIALLLRFPKLPSKLLLARVTFGRYVRSGLYEMGAEFLECVNSPADAQIEAAIPHHWIMSAHQARQTNPEEPAAENEKPVKPVKKPATPAEAPAAKKESAPA